MAKIALMGPKISTLDITEFINYEFDVGSTYKEFEKFMTKKYNLIIVSPSLILAGNNDHNVADTISNNPTYYGIKGIKDYIRNKNSVNNKTDLFILKYYNKIEKIPNSEIIDMKFESSINYLVNRIKKY